AYCACAFLPFNARSVPLTIVKACPEATFKMRDNRQLLPNALTHVLENFGMLTIIVAFTRSRISLTWLVHLPRSPLRVGVRYTPFPAELCRRVPLPIAVPRQWDQV